VTIALTFAPLLDESLRHVDPAAAHRDVERRAELRCGLSDLGQAGTEVELRLQSHDSPFFACERESPHFGQRKRIKPAGTKSLCIGQSLVVRARRVAARVVASAEEEAIGTRRARAV